MTESSRSTKCRVRTKPFSAHRDAPALSWPSTAMCFGPFRGHILTRVMKAKASFFFFFLILFILREKGREGKRKGKKHQCVVAFGTSPTVDPARNPGMCPDWESNRQPFGSQAGAQSTEPHWPRLKASLCLRRHSLNPTGSLNA